MHQPWCFKWKSSISFKNKMSFHCRDVRVQILIWYQTFLLFTKPHFQTFSALLHWKAHLFRHFRLFQTFSHRHSHTPSLTLLSVQSYNGFAQIKFSFLFTFSQSLYEMKPRSSSSWVHCLEFQCLMNYRWCNTSFSCFFFLSTQNKDE